MEGGAKGPVATMGGALSLSLGGKAGCSSGTGAEGTLCPNGGVGLTSGVTTSGSPFGGNSPKGGDAAPVGYLLAGGGGTTSGLFSVAAGRGLSYSSTGGFAGSGPSPTG